MLMDDVYIKGFFVVAGIIIGAVIKAIYDHFKDKRDRQDKYYFALLEKRFETIQKAYELVDEMKWVINEKEELTSLTKKVSDWYSQNCLYLPPDLRKAFLDTIFDTDRFDLERDDYYSEGRRTNKWDTPEMKEKKKLFMDTFDRITKGMHEKIEKHIKIYYDYMERQ